MKKVCSAFADGINYYLFTNPQVKPKLIKRFQPWMPLLFSEGSIGGDIESVSLNGLKKFYGSGSADITEKKQGDGMEPEPKGSNGFAIAPFNTINGNALLLINPHTSFYFRSEVHVKSEEGLNAYGAVTWGQFFIYQGFNEHCGWMHTTSAADVIDSYSEVVQSKELIYKYGKETRPIISKKVTIVYKTDKGLSKKTFTTFATHHGPIVDMIDGKWIAVKMMNEPVKALTQSYQRTKSGGFSDFKKIMGIRANSSNNTVFADDKGNIAYWHGDYMPKRDLKFKWDGLIDGSDPQTDWKDLFDVDQIVHVYNPVNGWIQNCNSTPYTVSGDQSPDKNLYPSYMAPDFENFRGIHAVKVLRDEKAFTIDKLINAAYDSYLPAFEKLIPSLVTAYEEESVKSDTIKLKLAEPIELLRNWNLRFSETSVPTALAIYWAQRLRQDVSKQMPARIDNIGVIGYLTNRTSNIEKLKALSATLIELQRDVGTWKQPWGEINRFQRLTGKIEPTFDDSKPGIAVPFTSSFWGSLASFGARKYPNTKKMYGSVGNSFVAAVEFGKKVKAKSIVTGGSSSDPSSVHFNDQSAMYANGEFKDILFYDDEINAHVEKSYHPGQ